MPGQFKKSWRPWVDATIRVGIAFLVVAVQTLVGHAQVGHAWTFDELTEKADCVAIAEHIRTSDTGRRTTHPELTPGYPVVELETAFHLLAVLKPCGRTESRAGTTLRLKHYTLDRERFQDGLLNGGTALAFTTGAVYLMFLKYSEGNVYEPLSGHAFPTISVYRVPKPLE
jgi:hypothetical protein